MHNSYTDRGSVARVVVSMLPAAY